MTLPPYTVRVSERAKHVRFEVRPQSGLRVIVPEGFNQARLPKLLSRKYDWIQKALEKAEAQRKFLEPLPCAAPPEHIFLRAVDEQWYVKYKDSSGATGAYQTGERELSVRGDISDPEACKAALRRWAARQARFHLEPQLEVISEQTKLTYQRTKVGNQKTRWASCSSRGTISLNLKLLFLPPQLVRYVLIHELAHTVHLNHSKAFWTLLRTKEPNYKRLDRAMRDAWQLIPHWVETPRARKN